ncbi:MAG: hypothetical protein AVDCRST_MAG19-4479 [uncultured Thermomicrobiales bacterium]|uniref:Uncharacterized protein n=1 Tax=uncultured Thermomicrobiales bacterium TaxID=1645740 RepID=A0A6J4VT54_9BACT|nr:MAG: hypothetical protein AVDCRST_MAG19-4479 [uncultured Thermomicrobiales bacterium]
MTGAGDRDSALNLGRGERLCQTGGSGGKRPALSPGSPSPFRGRGTVHYRR